ncbi:DUF4912 domain-containing protein [Treponema pectinovorum]|uniref:DUF4912 domain-containing protein n=1 Tax=Treponema pectinovorum TaxID=164 RepID=UPI003D8AE2CE
MDIKILNRSHLETLSTADLITLCDEFGIDIPENLNRSFIIGELLEIAEEYKEDFVEDDISTSEEIAPVSKREDALPESYNETNICAILRNPAWIYVYWDISSSDIARLNADFSFKSLYLRVSFWQSEEDEKPLESFDVQIGISDRQQYVLLSPGKNFVRVDLVARYSAKEDENLAITRKIELPKGSSVLNSLPGRELNLPVALELSDMKELLTSHFENHRQSFL